MNHRRCFVFLVFLFNWACGNSLVPMFLFSFLKYKENKLYVLVIEKKKNQTCFYYFLDGLYKLK